MIKKLFGLCAAVALLFAFATANVANAQVGVACPTGCPCAFPAAPCPFMAPAIFPAPSTAFRVGPFGTLRPVVYTPVYRVPVVPVVRPIYLPVRAHRAAVLHPVMVQPPFHGGLCL